MSMSKVEVTGLARSIIASGYAMRTDLSSVDKDIDMMEYYLKHKDDMKILYPDTYEIADRHYRRFISLASSRGDRGHPQCLSGVKVTFDLLFSNKAWVEAERYKYLVFITSQSTIHRIASFNLDEVYNKYVNPEIINIMKQLVEEWNTLVNEGKTEEAKEQYLRILYSNPAGFELTASMTTSYRCLLNIYWQRYNHRLPEWRTFCKQIRELPLMNDIIEASAKNHKSH